jgi:hypothetical protein
MDACNAPPAARVIPVYTSAPKPAPANRPDNSDAYQPPLKAAPLLPGQGTRVDQFA